MARQASILILSALAFVCLAAAPAEAGGQDVEQVKAWLRDAVPGDEVGVRLADGEYVEGTLAEVEDTRFGIWVEPDDAAKERYGQIRSLKRWIDYAEVVDLIVGGIPVGASDGSLSFRLRFGDEARVRTSSGSTLKGKVMDFDGTDLRIEGQTLSLSDGDVQRIEIQQRDSLTNGALIGFGAGAAFVGIACTAGCDAELLAYGVLFYGAVGAGIGALIDSAFESYTTIYVASEERRELAIVPFLTPDAKGVSLSFRF